MPELGTEARKAVEYNRRDLHAPEIGRDTRLMGPRDWLPPTSAYEVDYKRRRRPGLLLDDRCPGRRSSLFLAVLSLLLGAIALACAVAPLLPAASGARWVLTTVGVSAVFTGADAIRRRRGRASLLVTALSTIGIGAGVIATVAMAATFFAANSGGTAQAAQGISRFLAPNASTSEQAAPLPPAPAAAAVSIGQMEESVGTLAFLMRHAHQAGTRWPAVLQVSQDGVVTAPGMPGVELRLPAGTVLGYRTSTDGTAYAVRLSSTSDPNRYVDFDTNSGVVTAGGRGAAPNS